MFHKSVLRDCIRVRGLHVVVMQFIEAWKDHPGWAHHRYDGHVIPWPKEEVLSWVPEREESDSLGKRHLEEPWKDMKKYEKIWIHLFPLNRFKSFHYVPLTFCPDSSWQKVKWYARFQFSSCKAEEDEKRWAKSGVRKKNQNQPETKNNLRWYYLRWWWNMMEYGGRV